jgi:LPS-assembly protein
MHASARFALIFALGLSGVLRAAENLPPLRVDPALLGGPIHARPLQRPAAPSAETGPAASAPLGQGVGPIAPAREERVSGPPAITPSRQQGTPAVSATAPQAEPASPAAPAVEMQARKQPSLSAPPLEARQGPAAAVSAQTETAASARQAQTFEPPQIEERPALPPLYSAHAEAGLVPRLKPTGRLSPLKVDKNVAYPTFIAASRIDGHNDNEVLAQGDAELRRANTALTADRLTYWKLDDEMEAEGRVRYNKDADSIAGPKLRLNLTEDTGFFERPVYSITRAGPTPKETYSPALGAAVAPVRKLPSFLPRQKEDKPVVVAIAGEVVDGKNLTTASGKADRLEFRGENRLRLTNATYSTCTADDPDWYARAAQIDLDYDREIGEGRDATLVFKGVPLFYTPWIGFSLNHKRKSGFLAPTFGTSSKSGLEFTQPYYWDIAPNMDATISPRLMSKRGLQVNTEFRYLNYDYQGRAHVEWLPEDRLYGGKNRYGYSLYHLHPNLGHGFSALVNVNGVSDTTYMRDLSTRISEAAQGNLLRQGVLGYSGGWWSVMANMQLFQTLQDPALPPVSKPYERVPQLLLTANRPDFIGGTAFAFNGEYVVFDHPSLDTAHRLTLYPKLSLPLIAPAWYITPKIGLHATRYDIARRSSVGPERIVRNLPVFSVDAGIAFERDFDWFGKGLTQTLEPRLFYLLVPQRTQDRIPVFDSGRTDFNFATIFSDNVYAGVDRIADANQLTAALTSRLLDPRTGEEYVRGMVGQRYYFAKQHVTLPGESARPSGTSDFLAALSGRLLPRTYTDVAWQYDPRGSQTERFSVGARWQPEFAKVLNASYRYTRDHTLSGGTPGIRQVDFSGQWPLAGAWYGVGRFNYSLKERRIIETIGGLEYNGGCWIGRLVLQRYATATGDSNTALFVQLELNDFSKIGSNPLELLARRIPGYGRINQLPADPVFGYE